MPSNWATERCPAPAECFPGWEFYAPVAGADRSIFGLLPEARVILDEPEALKTELGKVWARIEEAHERSGVGNLVRPADLYLTPEVWQEKTAARFDALTIDGFLRKGNAETRARRGGVQGH